MTCRGQMLYDDGSPFGPLYFTLDEKRELVPAEDALTWAIWRMEHPELVTVAQTQGDKYIVSTVFSGVRIDAGTLRPFETAVFSADLERMLHHERSTTWAEAEQVHAGILELLGRGLAPSSDG